MKIDCYNFKDKIPEQGQWFAFVCPIQKDRWEIGWMDWYCIRIEGGNSYKKEELTLWIPLPKLRGGKISGFSR